jgi:hypothetical protein
MASTTTTTPMMAKMFMFFLVSFCGSVEEKPEPKGSG